MRGFTAFVKKECMENVKNHRLLILTAVFLIFGITNAPLAKYTPDILSALADGLTMNAEPIALDAWTQFFKNNSGIGMSAVIILFGGMLASEYTRGTLVLMVTKGLPRRTIILAKYVVSVLIMSLCYWLSFAVTYIYTAYYWPGNALSHTVLAAAALWLIGFFYLAVLLLGGVLFRQTFSAILFTGGIVALLSLANVFDLGSTMNPIRLTGDNLAIIEGSVKIADLFGSFVVTAVCTIVALVAAVKLFERKAL